MSEHYLDFLADCMDVPVECVECGHVTRLAGPQEVWDQDRAPTDEEIVSDLCECDAPYRIYVGDAPDEAAVKLGMLLDMIDLMPPDARQEWAMQTRDELSDE